MPGKLASFYFLMFFLNVLYVTMGFIMTFAHTDIMYFRYSHSTTLSFPVFFLLKLSPLSFNAFLLFDFFTCWIVLVAH